MIIWDLNPVAFSIGSLAVRWYGLVYATGFLLGYWILRQAAQRKQVPNLNETIAEDFVFWLMIGSIIGARLFHVIFYNPQYYMRHLLEVPAVWQGGLSIHGGLAGAVLVGWYFTKRHRIEFYRLADLLVVPLALAFIFGKLTNYANAELVGKPTSVSWCVQYPDSMRIPGCRHPVQIYEALYGYGVFLVLAAMQVSKRFASGVIFWTFMLLYGMLRFIVSFFREPESGEAVIMALSVGQWLSLMLVAAALLWLLLKRRRLFYRESLTSR